MFANALLFGSALLALGLGASALPARPELEERASKLATVYQTCKNPNHVAITFDDGPYLYRRHIVDKLDQYGAKGTFFVNGNNWVCIYDQDRVDDLNYSLQKGHEIQAHTWSHPHLTTLNYHQIKTEFIEINDAIRKVTGKQPALMRPPYGEYDDNVLKVAASLSQQVVIWDQDSGDSVGATLDEQKKVYSDFASKKNQKAIFLNHEVYHSTAYQLLPYALQTLSAKGYQMVTLSECLGLQPYLASGAPSKRDSTWTC